MRPRVASTVLALALCLLAGCARGPRRDPIEPVNRAFFSFNDALDRWVMEPVSHCYLRVVPEPPRNCVSNFFHNLKEINTIPNQFLQGKPLLGLSDTGRFAVNTTVGVVGLFDVGRRIGLERHEEDLGQTLGVWGVGEGAYLVIPLIGPSTARDLPGVIVSAIVNRILFLPMSALVVTPIGVLGTVDRRASADAQLDAVEKTSNDKYAFVRDAYRENRTFLIHDGKLPAEKVAGEEFDDFGDFDFDEDAGGGEGTDAEGESGVEAEPDVEAVPDVEAKPDVEGEKAPGSEAAPAPEEVNPESEERNPEEPETVADDAVEPMQGR